MKQFMRSSFLVVSLLALALSVLGSRLVSAALVASNATADYVYGQGGSFTSNGNMDGAQSLSSPKFVTMDSAGNLYVADAGYHRVLYFPAGSTVATRVYGQGGSFNTTTPNKGGVSTDSLDTPYGVAVDASNNVYIADSGNNRVLYYPAGTNTATRVYGQSGLFTANTANNGGISTDSLAQPFGVALASDGGLFVADSLNNRVLYYPPASTTATRVYGQGGDFTTTTINKGGISKDSLYTPTGVAVDSTGNLYVSDSNNNRVLLFPAVSTSALRVYGQGGSMLTNTNNKNGLSATSLSNPRGLRLDGANNLYVVDVFNNRVLFYLEASSTATLVYGQGGFFNTPIENNGGISATSLYFPSDVVVDSNDNVYVVDDSNNRVLYYAGSSTTASGVYGQIGSFTSNVSTVQDANSLNSPRAVALDPDGNVYVADAQNNRVLYYPAGSRTATRVYGQDGSFTSSAKNKGGGVSADSLSGPNAVVVDSGGNLYVGDTNNYRVLFYLAGSTTATRVYGQSDFTSAIWGGDSPNENNLTYPQGLALDIYGNLYVADRDNNRVLFYPVGSTSATLVYGQGDFTTGAANQGAPNPSANTLKYPNALALDISGNLYISDSGNHRVLFYLAGSTTATVVYGQGSLFNSASPNNGGVSADSLFNPSGLALDSDNSLYIADRDNHRLLYFTSGSTTATMVYGQGGVYTTATDNNGGVSALSLFTPGGLAVNSLGDIYAADTGNNRVLVFMNKFPPVITFGTAPTPVYLGGNFVVNGYSDNSDIAGVLTFSVTSGPCAVVSQSGKSVTLSSSGAGACVVNADSASTTNYLAGSKSLTVTIAKATPTVSFNLVPSPFFKGGNFTVGATTTNSDSPVLTYSKVNVGDPCTWVSGGTFSSTGAGDCVVNAESAATTNFNAASQNQIVTIGKAPNVVNFTVVLPTSPYKSEFTVVAVSDSGAEVTYTYVSGPCTQVSGGTFTSSALGPCLIQAGVPATNDYTDAVQDQTVTIVQATPIISFDLVPSPFYLGGNFTVQAITDNSDSPALTYSYVSGPCAQVTGGEFSFTDVGNCVVKADSVATTNYTAASQNQTVIIDRATPVITFTSPSSVVLKPAVIPVSATSNNPEDASLTYSMVSGPCSWVNGALYPTDAEFQPGAGGVCVVRAEGVLTAHYKAVNKTHSITLTPATGAITFNPAPAASYQGANFTVVAHANSGKAVTYSYVRGACAQVAGGEFSPIGAGVCEVKAEAPANVYYTAAAKNLDVPIARVVPVISFTSSASVLLSAGYFTVIATTTNTDSDMLVYTPVSGPCIFVSGAVFYPTGMGTCVVRASSTQTGNYAPADTTYNITIRALTFMPLIKR
jgi:sugar lactone lactonase YvrE